MSFTFKIFVDYKSFTRRHLLDGWQKEIGSILKNPSFKNLSKEKSLSLLETESFFAVEPDDI